MRSKSIVSRIKYIQQYLNVNADGIIGADTLTAISNKLFENADENKLWSLTISRAGRDQLMASEITSLTHYQRFLQSPVWPGGGSGITIGIGYDLGYHRGSQIQQDWACIVSDKDIQALVSVCGLTGKQADKALKSVSGVEIPYAAASQVFCESSLPRYAARTKKVYPGVELLLPDAQAAILSLVYNRGTAMSGVKRKEMAAIKPLVKQKDYSAIADEIISMKRLWIGSDLDSLLKRRDDEADLVRYPSSKYQSADLIRV